MKHLFLTLTLNLFIGFSFTQQKKFLNADQYQQNLIDAYILLEEGTTLDSTLIDFEAEHYTIAFAFDPESTNEQKKAYITSIRSQIETLARIRQNSLKALTLQMGEQIFLSSEDVASTNGKRKKQFELNMKKGWEELSPIFNQYLPGIPVYAFNWGW